MPPRECHFFRVSDTAGSIHYASPGNMEWYWQQVARAFVRYRLRMALLANHQQR